MAKKSSSKMIKVTWIKSTIGKSVKQKNTVRALGFRKLGETVEHTDTPAIRGMLDKVSHLVKVEEA